MDKKILWIGVGTVVLLSFAFPYLFQWVTNFIDNSSTDDETTTIPPPGGKEFNKTIITFPPESNTTPNLQGRISIESIRYFSFEPKNITTSRPDLFKPRYFSLFDILVYLDNHSDIDLDYSFNATLDSNIIHAINGAFNWWHKAYYSGGGWVNSCRDI